MSGLWKYTANPERSSCLLLRLRIRSLLRVQFTSLCLGLCTLAKYFMAHKISSITQHNASSLQRHSLLLRKVLCHNYASGRGDSFFNGLNVLFILLLALWRMKPETEPGSRLQWLSLYSETQVHICLFKCTNLIQIALMHVNELTDWIILHGGYLSSAAKVCFHWSQSDWFCLCFLIPLPTWWHLHSTLSVDVKQTACFPSESFK